MAIKTFFNQLLKKLKIYNPQTSPLSIYFLGVSNRASFIIFGKIWHHTWLFQKKIVFFTLFTEFKPLKALDFRGTYWRGLQMQSTLKSYLFFNLVWGQTGKLKKTISTGEWFNAETLSLWTKTYAQWLYPRLFLPLHHHTRSDHRLTEM